MIPRPEPKPKMLGLRNCRIPAKEGIWSLDIGRSGEATPGSADVSSAPVFRARWRTRRPRSQGYWAPQRVPFRNASKSVNSWRVICSSSPDGITDTVPGRISLMSS